MNIQGGVQDFIHDSCKAINTGQRVNSLPKIAKFIDHYTSGSISLFVHLDNHLYNTDSFIIVYRLVSFALLFAFQLQDLVILKLIWE